MKRFPWGELFLFCAVVLFFVILFSWALESLIDLGLIIASNVLN